jgi:hypothetical protein
MICDEILDVFQTLSKIPHHISRKKILNFDSVISVNQNAVARVVSFGRFLGPLLQGSKIPNGILSKSALSFSMLILPRMRRQQVENAASRFTELNLGERLLR